MTPHWDDSYTGQLRQLVGHHPLIIPSVRAVIGYDQGKILFVRRRGSGRWGMPAGSIELGESIFDCLRREAKEETGLNVLRATLIAVYTEADRMLYSNRFGDQYQMFEFLFRVDNCSGTLVTSTDETRDARYFTLDMLPEPDDDYWAVHHRRVFEDLERYNGEVILR